MIFVWSLKFYHKPVRSCSILAKKKARFYVGFGVSQTPIKKYVLEETGLKVSNLYIAQVKDKHGLEKRENYNLSKSEDARQPKCPKEKEKAIEDALRHFQMILLH